MLRDVFYYNNKPNVHPREKHATSLEDARRQSTTEHFWIINEFCDYKGFDWDFDFEFLPDEDVWAEGHINVWPSQHQKDSGTWLCNTDNNNPLTIYRADVEVAKRKNVKSDNWIELDLINDAKFDFSWHPDPSDPPYIYKWGCKYFPVEFKSYIEYHVEGATEIKYMNSIVELLPNWEYIVEVQKVDQSRWDMSWRPDPREPAHIYVWGNKYIDGRLRSTLEYHVPGATETKYMPEMIPVLPEWERWEIIHEVDKTTFDFCWRPDPREPDLIYVFGNKQHAGNIMPTIEYRMPGASDRKYLSTQKAKLAAQPKRFEHLENSYGIDYSWTPDPTSPPYIYVWGNQWNKPEDKISIQYVVEGATEYKYMEERAIRKPCLDNWAIPADIDCKNFDFSWEPSPADPAFIYEFGTQWQKTGGPRYQVDGATETKYVDILKATALPNKTNWTVPAYIDTSSFDFSWHPDASSPPYIYYFPTQWALSGGPVYTVAGASEIKYVEDITAKAIPDRTNWEIPAFIDADSFDFSWHPYTEDEPYYYQFGTQWQKTGGPRYISPGVHKSSATKYIDTRIIKAKRLPSKKGFATLNNASVVEFDYSWHPDTTEEPYIYIFGNNQYSAEMMPTIEYAVPGANQIKYISEIIATLGENKKNWIIPENLNTSEFDFSWVPNPKDSPYIYEFGTQWQKTGGPRYVVPDADETKFIADPKVTKLPSDTHWSIPSNIDISNFDFSWHPDDTSPPYIYRFPTQWAISGGPVYTVPGATEIKYVENITAKAISDKTNWEIPAFIDADSFDFSWHPYVEDEPYYYQFGTQWQKTGGPRYISPGVHKNSATKYIDTRIIKAKRLPSKKGFAILNNASIVDFDYSWHPDVTDEPYIYIFGNNQYPAEIMPTIEYAVPGATQVKYISEIIATLGENKKNWIVPENLNTSEFDFSWVPNPKDSPYIYEFGTQWQKTGGPRYVVSDAAETKFIDHSKAVKLPSDNNWSIPSNIDTTDFDFSWHPDDTSPPYIYRFSTQWAISGGPVYTVAGATEIKYVEDITAKAIPDRTNWEIPAFIDADSFDFSWHPYVEDEPYIYQFGTQWQKTGGPRYITPGVHKSSAVKYIDTRIIKAKRLPSKKGFATLSNLSVKEFDYSWHPDVTDEPYIYLFGNNHYPAETMATIEYVVPGAKQIKYVHDIVATLAVDMTNWEVPKDLDTSLFDFSWKPNPNDPAFIYQFGTQWQKTDGPRYVVTDATQVKYMDDLKAIKLPSDKNWVMPEKIKIANFDTSWHPDATEKPYNYQFGTQWVLTGGPKYITSGATETKFIDVEEHSATAGKNMTNWLVPDEIEKTSFDFSWHPHPDDPPFVYQFSTQWQKTGGPKFVAEGAEDGFTPVKYIDGRILKAKRLSSKKNWVIAAGIDTSKFDFSWHPDDTAPRFEYQFGTLSDKDDGPRYVVPDAGGQVINLERTEIDISTIFPQYFIETTLEALINKHPDQLFWALNPDLDYTGFDFDWRPDIEQAQYVHAFGSQDNINTQTYFVNATQWLKGFRDINYVEDKTIDVKINIDMFFVDRGNEETQQRFNELKIKFPNLQKTRYLNSWVDTINRCINRASSNLCWILNSELDYGGFDFNFYPNPWQMKMIQVFGTQWSHWGTTFMVNRETFAQDTKYVKIIEHLSNLNFVKDRRAQATNVLYDLIYIDHGNLSDKDFSDITNEGRLVVKYDTSYLNTFKAMLASLPVKKEHYVWVISTVCDYTGFDFTYICDPFAREQLHVFPSDRQKAGDTFLVDVNKLRELITDMTLLEEYQKINYNQNQRVKRLLPPMIISEGDTHVSSDIANADFNFPYAVFTTSDNKDILINDVEPMSLWSPESKSIQVTSVGGTRIIAPKEIKDYVKRELYDYPYIMTNAKLAKSTPMDIVFLSNGEVGADANYEHLLNVTQGLPNRVVRVDGINGRVAAYHAAAQASNTPWMFTVFAKLKVSNKFDWNWQPDRLQLPKHYVFHARNPVNGLLYGHQAMIAYNKKLTLANQGKGLDFTMDDEHEVVKITSGTAVFNTDEFSTWRTAFREALKLKADTTEISKERLEFWLTVGMGEFSEYSTEGAQHAVEYYEEVGGDLSKLKLSYDWPWLQARFNATYSK